MSKTQNLTLQEAVEAALDGRESQVRCPSHEDNSPSLSVKPGRTQPILFHCHAGCDPEDIIGAGGLDWAQVCNPLDEVARVQEAGTWTPAGIASNVYRYTDPEGTVLFEVMRVPQEGGGKRFLQRRPDATAPHGYRWNLDGVQRTLFQLPDVLRAVRDGNTIHVAEGEKCVEALNGVIPENEVATCNSGGAGKWLPQYTESLAGANVIIYADADDPGRAHARMVRDELLAASCTVTIKEPRPGVLPSGKTVGDVADHIEGGWSLDLLLETTPQSEIERARTGIDILDLVLRPRGTFEWALDGTMAKGERLILIGFEGTGKGGRLSEPVPTPTGWTTMGALRAGDEVIDAHGNPCRVTVAFEPYMPETLYRLTFSDGTTMVADAPHQWVTWTIEAREADSRRRRSGREYRVKHNPEARTTQEIVDTLLTKDGKTNHSIKVCGALDLPEVDLPIPPYSLGVWLGDGTTASGQIAVAERDAGIMDGLLADGLVGHITATRHSCHLVRIAGLTARLRTAGVLGNKHIPAVYLRASIKQRLDLLAGLMDTDGTCNLSEGEGRGHGAATQELCFTHEPLARGALELLLSLGVKAVMGESPAAYILDGERHVTGTRYRIQFQSDFNPYRYASFKAERWAPLKTARSLHRFIVGAESIEPEMVRCIQVDSPDHTYLWGENFIPTHNSTLCRQIAVMAAAGLHPFFGNEMKSGPKRVLYIDSENHPDQTLDSWNELVGKVRFHGHDIERGALTILEEWEHERDLCDIAGRSWLLERVHAYEPDIVIMGPLTNLASKDLRDDEPVRRIKQAVNEARNVCNSAFIMEHHAPLKGSMDKERPMRPYGSSLFLKWPDYGFGIKPTDSEGVYDWFKNRGPRVRSRLWPERLQEGRPNTGDFPWREAEPE